MQNDVDDFHTATQPVVLPPNLLGSDCHMVKFARLRQGGNFGDGKGIFQINSSQEYYNP